MILLIIILMLCRKYLDVAPEDTFTANRRYEIHFDC